MTTRSRLAALVTSLAFVAAACSGTDAAGSNGAAGDGADPTATDAALQVAPASFDVAVEDDARFTVGLFTSQRDLVLGGSVQTTFSYLGDGSGTPEEVATTEADFLPVPGREPETELTQATAVSPAEGAGVYETHVDLDRAGFWRVVVRADVEGLGEVEGQADFPVAEEHAVPAVGDQAPRTEGPVIGDDVPPVQIDSRAQGEDAEIPAPEIHDRTVADALDAGIPTVVVVSTPTYCVSQFCGPITDTIAGLEQEYRDVAEFIHLEVWADFNEGELNEAAAQWIQTEEGGNEPWVFLVDGDGTIMARWDNVLNEAELVEQLQAL
jgi:hypothetical protein